MINIYLKTHMKSQKPKDWTTQVLKDLRLEMTFEELKEIKKSKLKRILNIHYWGLNDKIVTIYEYENVMH